MNVESVTQEAAEIYHSAADGVNAVIRDHSGDLPVERVCAIAEYRDHLREQAFKLEQLSYRLREQARRIARERQDNTNSCRVCCASIPASEDGLCYVCRFEFAANGARSLSD